jgi:hypothetical protein
MGLPINVTLGLDKLVETFANATGLTALGKIMNAKGEAKAEAILSKKRAETDAEVEILKIQGQEKVAQYVLARNSQKVENVGGVLSKAEQQFLPEEQVSNDPVDKDWMTRFLDIAEEISDEDMQEIWGRVLAGEIKKPKSYSLRTLEVLRNLSKEEAALVTKVSNFQVALDLLCTEDFALDLTDQITLDDIGIICGEELVRTYTVSSSGKIVFILNKQALINVYAPTGTKFDFKGFKMTKAGMEIMGLIQEHSYADFYAKLSNYIKSKGAAKVTINEIINWNGSQYQYVSLEREI